MDFATVDNVSADWGDLTLDQEERVEEWISQASDKLRLKGLSIGIDVDQLVSTNPIALKGARNAVVAAIRRRLTNPTGQQQFSQTNGPFSKSGSFGPQLASGALYIAAEDLTGWLVKPKPPRKIQSFRVNAGMR